MIDSAESLCSVLMKNFGLLALRNTCCGNACFGAQVSSKYELDVVNKQQRTLFECQSV